MKWEALDGIRGVKPASRVFHSFVRTADGAKLIVFAGDSNDSLVNDSLSLSLSLSLIPLLYY